MGGLEDEGGQVGGVGVEDERVGAWKVCRDMGWDVTRLDRAFGVEFKSPLDGCVGLR
jgi:hypothetical protein